jgi:SAM-dependent methyltransferase
MNKIKMSLMTIFIKTVGRLSTGVNLSFKFGFTSGYMLDYIYENKPHGKFFIGKILDKAFLNNIGWQVIRQRKDNLKKYLKEAIGENRKNGVKTIILDVASGPAKYILEVLVEAGEQDTYATCQDIDQRWLDYGREQADKLGLKNIRFEKGDAFNLQLLSKVMPQPNIVVSSGFYDWITDDELIKKSFNYCYSILPAGGKIIFTNQAGHQQMELVQAVFVDFNKEPLRMKTRPVDLICGWAKESGFQNLNTSIDKWGLYSVSKGEKR